MPLIKEYKRELSLDEQELIYDHYGIRLFQRVHSPIRSEDNPSFSTYKFNDTIRWKDFGTGDGGNVYNLIMAMEGVCFTDSLKLAKDILNSNHIVNSNSKRIHTKDVKREVVVFNHFRDFEIEYWEERGITETQLISNLVYPLKMLLIDGKFKCTSVKETPRFVYYMNDFKNSWKVYSPLDNQDLKWVSHNISSVNYESPLQFQHNNLVILSSKKDKMVFDNLKLPFDTTSLLAEGNYRGIISELNGDFKRYDNVYCLLDFDKAGERSTQNIEKESGGVIKGVYISLEASNYLYSKSIKDLDEVMVHLGKDALMRLIKKIL